MKNFLRAMLVWLESMEIEVEEELQSKRHNKNYEWVS